MEEDHSSINILLSGRKLRRKLKLVHINKKLLKHMNRKLRLDNPTLCANFHSLINEWKIFLQHLQLEKAAS